MTATKTVILKGELHSSEADLREERRLLTDDVDVLVLEGSRTSPGHRLGAVWFSIAIALLAWLLASIYRSKDVLVDVARAGDVEVVYTRRDDLAPLANATLPAKVVSAGLFYTLVPASLWIGFVTESDLAGSLLLFLGLVAPVLVVRIYNANRPDAAGNRDRLIAETIDAAGDPGDVVLGVVGAGHLEPVARRLPASVDLDVRPPVYDVWSVRHARAIGLPMVKTGFVLVSLYALSAWIVVRLVGVLTPVVAGLIA